MKERPILFTGAMVRALLDGSKMQTRRICKPAMSAGLSRVIPVYRSINGEQRPPCASLGWFGDEEGDIIFSCPYGQPGDQLWVRETFRKVMGQTAGWIETDFRATYQHGDRLGDLIGMAGKWTPSIHMPRVASRISLEITDVRVERLQNISEPDAFAEGVSALYGNHAGASYPADGRLAYELLWESINGAGSWAVNPWVWVVEFRRITNEVK